MKKLTLSVATVLLMTVVFVSSCSKSSTSPNSSTVSFTAGGTSYSYSAGTNLVGHTYSNQLQFVKNETNDSHNSLSFLGGHNASGTYAFDYTTTLQWSINSKIYSSNSTNANGNITITLSGTSATATFSTILYNIQTPSDSVIVTNGSYTGSYLSTQ